MANEDKGNASKSKQNKPPMGFSLTPQQPISCQEATARAAALAISVKVFILHLPGLTLIG